MEKLAPIVIFAFNRPEAFKATLDNLKVCPEAKDSDLFIFIDGPRLNNEDDTDKVAVSQCIAKNVTGFKSITYNFSDINRGLGPSIINGVSKVIYCYGSVIVLEDDLIVNKNFLTFMNKGLLKYEHDEKVWSICGYTNKVHSPKHYPWDAYFCTRSSSWGWATWADRWNSIDWSFDNWEKWIGRKKEFNKWGGSDCFGMLDGCRCGRNKSWAIRFCFNQFLQDKLSLFPVKSLVKNDGFDGQGSNCKRYSRFKYELMTPEKNDFLLPNTIALQKSLWRQAMYYNSIALRLWSRLMYLIK